MAIPASSGDEMGRIYKRTPSGIREKGKAKCLIENLIHIVVHKEKPLGLRFLPSDIDDLLKLRPKPHHYLRGLPLV